MCFTINCNLRTLVALLENAGVIVYLDTAKVNTTMFTLMLGRKFIVCDG